MGIFACTEKKYTHTARRSHFVFRNNTVCSGKRRGFPVIYRQSDEVRQTNPSNYFFPSHFSPFGRFSSPRPSLSRLRIGYQKRNGVKPFRFWHPAGERRTIPVSEKSLPPAHYSQFVFRNNTVCSGKRRGFPVIYRQWDEARQTEPPIISFPLISPLLGDRPARGRFSLPAANRMAKAERQSAVPLLLILLRRPSPRRTMRRRSDRRTPARRRSACCSFSAPATSLR